MGHMQGLGDLAVDGPGLNARVVPQLLGVLGGALEEALDAEGLAVLHQSGLGDLVGQVVDVLALGGDAPLAGDPLELLGVFDGVVDPWSRCGSRRPPRRIYNEGSGS